MPVLPVAMEDLAAAGCSTPPTGAEQLWDLPEEQILLLCPLLAAAVVPVLSVEL